MINNRGQNIKKNLILVIFLISVLFGTAMVIHQNNFVKSNFQNSMNRLDKQVDNAEDILLEKRVSNPIITIITLYVDNKQELIIKDNAGGITDDVIDKFIIRKLRC